ncbi:dihydrodipicolinate synthase family protein [Blastopirellula marina]|uniref:Dihydrodipicolinate synthase family protein n=1 Tax=Blastopirellula marina TaxID=124 RepID=A0A2S8F2E6_9BACT|nr:dihydrodipicolinate synthase family protein [Blastopirellula marina]PQO26319.1 dihydrodipicolinate synthase family protein [Blastopirellula marina]PTL40719.1 dihydrodipicolinate synthase family protein [Blastopirellula marina]
MSNQARLAGIFTPNIVPLDSKGDINEPELRRYVDWLIERGVHGLYPNGSTGEFLRFTAEERRRIIEIMADQTAGRVPILAGAAEANVRETIKACENYYEYGCRAVAIVSPFYYKLTPAGVYAYFKEIADNTPIDVTLYNIPMFASPIDVPTVQRLAEECPKIVAIKDSSGDLPHMMRMIAAVRPLRPDFAFMTGWDAALMPMMLIGCDGGTNATSGVVPEITRKLFDLTQAGRLAEARDLQYRLLKLFDAMLYNSEFPEGFRAALALRGFQPGRGRQPQSESQLAAIDVLKRELQCLLAAEGYVNEPVGGCAIKEEVDSDEVARIVQNVVGELKRRGLA